MEFLEIGKQVSVKSRRKAHIHKESLKFSISLQTLILPNCPLDCNMHWCTPLWSCHKLLQYQQLSTPRTMHCLHFSSPTTLVRSRVMCSNGWPKRTFTKWLIMVGCWFLVPMGGRFSKISCLVAKEFVNIVLPYTAWQQVHRKLKMISHPRLTGWVCLRSSDVKHGLHKSYRGLYWLLYADTVERFHIMAHLMFVLAQNFQNNEESWLANFAYVRVKPFYLYGVACAHSSSLL